MVVDKGVKVAAVVRRSIVDDGGPSGAAGLVDQGGTGEKESSTRPPATVTVSSPVHRRRTRPKPAESKQPAHCRGQSNDVGARLEAKAQASVVVVVHWARWSQLSEHLAEGQRGSTGAIVQCAAVGKGSVRTDRGGFEVHEQARRQQPDPWQCGRASSGSVVDDWAGVEGRR